MLRVAIRSLVRRPGFSLTALLTIAVAIAGNTAIFSMVRGVMVGSVPFPNPEQLVTVDVRSSQGYLVSNSMPNYQDWGTRSKAFRSYAGFAGWTMTLTGRGAAEAVDLQAIVGDFFGTLGLSAANGRVMFPDELGRTPQFVAVLGNGYWRRTLGGDPAAVGRVLILDGKPFTVIGVLPPGTGFPGPDVEMYIPMASISGIPWEDRRSGFGMRMIARLNPGVTVPQAREEMTRLGQQVRAENTADTGLPELRSLTDYLVADVRLQVWLLMGAVAFVLLIAAGNVANLLLARGEERRQEMAVRTALGAGRGVLVRQILTESVVLSLAGGVVGALLAAGCIKVLLSIFGPALPALAIERIRLDTPVLAFALLVSLATGMVFGAIPALRASRIELAEEMKAGGRGVAGKRDRLRSLLVVSELASALVLLVGAALVIQSLQNLNRVDKGFSAENVLTTRVRLPRAIMSDTARWRDFYENAVARIQRLPGVKTAAASLLLPLSERSWERGIWPEGVPPEPGTGQSVLYNVVSPGYFNTLGVTIVKGRGFTPADRLGASPVAIIDETMAARFWPGGDPLNKRVTLERTMGGHEGEPIYRTVIGVTRNVRHYTLSNPSRIQVYIPMAQVLMGVGPTLSLIAKTSSPPATLIPSVRQAIGELNPDVPLANIETMQEYMDAGLAGNRALVKLLGAFGATALLLASIGIFGVMSYTVAQRTREIGVRMALGATRGAILGWVARRALLLCGIGLAAGTVAAAGLSRFLRGVLYQVSTLDLSVYAGVALLLLIAALAAALLPAKRAAGVDPIRALRSE